MSILSLKIWTLYGKKILEALKELFPYSGILFSVQVKSALCRLVHHSSPHSLTHDALSSPFWFSTCSFTVLLAVTISSTRHPPKNRSTRKW
ncbi:hypothetical protein BT69DRAFT_1288839 [Atractiella rhizophila]|nr:hypothetical protein BT69DRAFT_1288839 [Atractiella rhizophila]